MHLDLCVAEDLNKGTERTMSEGKPLNHMVHTGATYGYGCYVLPAFFNVSVMQQEHGCAVQGSSEWSEVSSFDYCTVPTAFKGLDFEKEPRMRVSFICK